MMSKRVIYRNGNLIPKKEEKAIQKDNITQDSINILKFINLSRNNKFINPQNFMPKIFISDVKNIQSLQTNEEEKIIYEGKTINEETQTNSTFQVNNVIKKFNENKTNDSNVENYKEKEDSFYLFKKNANKFIKKPKKATLYWQIEQICRHFYLNQSDENKENIFNKMYQKENEFVRNLNKNFLNNDDLTLRKKYSVRNFSKLIKSNPTDKSNSFNHYKVKINRSFKSKKINKEELIKKSNDEELPSTGDNKKRTKYNFEKYGINLYRYKHPQIYQLKSEDKIKLPAIKKNKKDPIELANIIPVKKGINKEEKINEYKFYKIMRNSRFNKFQV